MLLSCLWNLFNSGNIFRAIQLGLLSLYMISKSWDSQCIWNINNVLNFQKFNSHVKVLKQKKPNTKRRKSRDLPCSYDPCMLFMGILSGPNICSGFWIDGDHTLDLLKWGNEADSICNPLMNKYEKGKIIRKQLWNIPFAMRKNKLCSM